MAAMARDNTMVATAKEGISFLQKEGADDLIKLQGLDGAKSGGSDGAVAEPAASSQTAESSGIMETDAPPTLAQHRTMVETAKEAETVLAGETLGETRASTEQLKAAVASSSPPQKSRTMVETAKIGQALLGEDAALIGETRQQTAEVKKQTEEGNKETEKSVEKKEEEKSAEKEVESVEGKKSPAKKSPPKKSPAKEKASPPAKKEKKQPEPKASPAKKAAEEKVAEEKTSPVKKDDEEKPAEKSSPAKKDPEEKPAKATTPRKRSGRPSLVDQLVQEAQKFAGNSAGDVSEGRVTRRALSKGSEPAAASPVKRPRQAKEKSKEKPVEADDKDEADD